MTILDEVKARTVYEDVGAEFDTNMLATINDAMADIEDVGYLGLDITESTEISELAFANGLEATHSAKQNALGYMAIYISIALEPAQGNSAYAQANKTMDRKLHKLRREAVNADTINNNRNRI